MERLWFLTSLSDSRLIKAILSYFHNPLCEQHVTKSSQNTYNLWGNCTTVHKTIRGNKGLDSHHSFPLFCGLPKKFIPLVGQTLGPIECHKLCFIAYILYLLKYNVRLKSEHTYRHQLDAFPVEELQSHRDVLQLHLPERGALVVLAEHLLLAEHLQKRDQPEPIAQVRLQVR